MNEFKQSVAPILRQKAEELLKNTPSEQETIASEKYMELYNLEPTGYFTLSRNGEIIQLNISGAKILGKARSQLENRLFHLFVSDNSKPLFLLFLGKVFTSGKNESCELTLSTNDDMPVYVYLTGIVSKNSGNCLITVIDITERKLLEVKGKTVSLSGAYQDISERKQAEEALLESEHKFRNIFENSPVGISMTNLDGSLNVNNAFCSILGYTREELSKLKWQDITCPDDIVKTQDAIDSLLSGVNLNVRFEKRYIHKNGNIIWALLSSTLQRDINGKPLYLMTTIIDVTEKKQTEASLLVSEKKYHSIFENVQDVFYQTDLAGTILEVSPSIENILGFSRDEIIGKPVAKLSFDFKSKDMFFYKLKENGELRDYELRLKTKTGEFKYTSINARLILDADGKPNHIDGAIRDITQRKTSEVELKASKEFLKNIINAVASPVFVKDDNHKYVLVNNALCSLLKIPMEKIIGSDDSEYFSEEQLKVFIEKDNEVLKTGKENSNEEFITDGTGNVRTIVTRKTLYTDTAGNKFLVGVINDITERKLAEKQIERLNRVYTVLSNINKTIIRVRDRQLLFEESCRIAVETGGFKMAWIGMVNSATNKIDVVTSFGKTGEFLNNINIDLNNKAFNSGPAGQAIKSGKCNFSNNIETDDRKFYWREKALEYGYRSVIALPVIVWGKTIGVYMIYSGEIDFFNEDEIKLLEEMASDISFAIEFIESRMERTMAEKALRKSEAIQRKIVSNIGDVIVIIDQNGINRYKSPNIETLFGWKPEDLVGNSAWNLVHPDDLVSTQKIVAEIALIPNATETSEIRYRRKDGEYVWIEITLVNLLSDPDIKGFLGNYHDITERRRAEDSLVKLKTAIDKSEISVVITDKNGNIEYANPFFNKITGYSPEEYIGKNSKILKSAYHPKEFYEEMWNTIKSGKTWEGELYNCNKKGEMYWENVIISPIANYNKEITNFVAIKTDITQAKNMNSELIIAKERAEESDRLKSAFLANMSHEIRTPMNGILGFTELLKEPDLSGDELKYYISIIEKSGARLLNIINDIVDISKIESGQMKVKLSLVNANEYLDQVLAFFNPEAEAKNIKLICKPGLPKEEAFLKTDSEKFYAILINLIKNALKYTETGFVEFGYNCIVETQCIASLPNHSYLQFYVKDTGIGIPKDRQEAIFERFVQADIVDKMARQGAGLGLSISKAYVEMLRGKIGLESEEENLSAGKAGGSTFYFTLPFSAKPEPENNKRVKILGPLKDVQVNPEVSGLKILIAEDDESSSEFISICVREFGKEVIKVQTGREAVEACRDNPDIDLILMDIQMPEVNGYDATRQIRQFNKEVIIIALTAFALAGDREKAIEAGCNDYISKPVKMAELVEMIQKYFKV